MGLASLYASLFLQTPKPQFLNEMLILASSMVQNWFDTRTWKLDFCCIIRISLGGGSAQTSYCLCRFPSFSIHFPFRVTRSQEPATVGWKGVQPGQVSILPLLLLFTQSSFRILGNSNQLVNRVILWLSLLVKSVDDYLMNICEATCFHLDSGANDPDWEKMRRTRKPLLVFRA